MRIKRRFDYRKLFAVFYIAVAAYCFALGLRPAGATRHEHLSYLGIPSIGLLSNVESLSLNHNKLRTPDMVVGGFSYKNSNRTFLVGHSTTVFRSLDNTKLGDLIIYNDKAYVIVSKTVEEKANIHMSDLLRGDLDDYDTLAIMTCAGELFDNGDASHRLIIIASEI